MAKVFNRKTKEIMWEDDICCRVEDAWFEVLDVLNGKRLDGHKRDDQWLMKVEMRLHDLINTLNEDPTPVEDIVYTVEI